MDTTNNEYLDLTQDTDEEESDEKDEANIFGLELLSFEMPELDLGLTNF